MFVAVVFDGEAGEGGFLSLPVALAFDDEFEGSGLQTVDGGLGQQWVGHHGHHLRRLLVGGDDRGRVPVAFHDQFVEVAGLGGAQRVQGQVVQNQHVDAVELAHLLVVGVVQPGRAQPFEQLVGAFGMHGVLTADRGVAQRVGQERLSDPDRAQTIGPPVMVGVVLGASAGISGTALVLNALT